MSCSGESFYVAGLKTGYAWAEINGRRTRVVAGQASTDPVGDGPYDFPEVSVHELIEDGWSGEMQLPLNGGGEPPVLQFNPDAAYGRAGRAELAATLAANPRAVLYVNIKSLKDEDNAGYTATIGGAVMALTVIDGLAPGSAQQHQMYDLAERCPKTMAAMLKDLPSADLGGDGRPGEIIMEMTNELAQGDEESRKLAGEVISSYIAGSSAITGIGPDYYFRGCNHALATLSGNGGVGVPGVVDAYLRRGLNAGDDLSFAVQVARSAEEYVTDDEMAAKCQDWVPKLLALSMQANAGGIGARATIAGSAATVMSRVMAAGAGPSIEQLSALYAGAGVGR